MYSEIMVRITMPRERNLVRRFCFPSGLSVIGVVASDPQARPRRVSVTSSV